MGNGTDILGTVEACQVIGIDRSTLGRWVDSGKAQPLRKLPGATGGYLFFRAHIEQLARDRHQQEDGEAAS